VHDERDEISTSGKYFAISPFDDDDDDDDILSGRLYCTYQRNLFAWK
jgi:hypothetical protein